MRTRHVADRHWESPKKKKQPEAGIKQVVKEYLQLQGWFVFHIQQGLLSHPGVSDLIAIKNGQVLFIEIKTPKGRLSDAQKVFQRNIESHGGTYVVVRSVEDVEHLIRNEHAKKYFTD